MKPPVSLEALMTEWSNDAPYNETDPDKSLARIPILHAKYSAIMSYHNMMAKKVAADYSKRKLVQWEWYRGKLSQEDLKEYGLEPIPKSIDRVDLPIHLDADPVLINILLKKMMHEEIVEYSKSILKELNNRTWNIRSYMDWKKWMGGN